MLDAFAMAIYIVIVYAASLAIGPLGRDYPLLADPTGNADPLSGLALSFAVRLFGDAAWAYHVLNLLLLYVCVLLLYALVRRLAIGPWWLGTLAATLFMANPVHSEAVLNLCGCVDLLPCMLALAAGTAYVESAFAPRVWKAVAVPLLYGAAVLIAPANLPILLVLVLFEVFLPPRRGRAALRLALPAAFTVLGACLSPETFSLARLNPGGMFGPLYLVFYPLGFLPSTARAFVTYPPLGWLAASVVLFVIFLVYRKARRPVILFGLLSAASVRLFQGSAFIDPVHMIGGGQLLAANAFFNVALVALFHRVMDHPKWRRPVVSLTTLLCVALFVLEFRSVLAWRHASEMARKFHQDVVAAVDEDEGVRPLVVLPDLRYYAGAPLCLLDTVSYNTPFGSDFQAESLLTLNYAPGMKANIEDAGGGERTVTISAELPVDLLCYPYVLSKPGDVLDTEASWIETVSISPTDLVLRVRDKAAGAARVITPAPLAASAPE